MSRMINAVASVVAATFLCACGASAQGGGVTLTRDATVGAKFGAPGPRSCSTTSLPTSGAITPALARAYIICGYEKDYQGGTEYLRLISHVQVQVANGRPYEHVRDSMENIDPHKTVYDIRGSSVRYGCYVPGATPFPNSQLCSRTVEKTDEGKCYQTTFNEWRCTWADFNVPISTDTGSQIPVPPASELE